MTNDFTHRIRQHNQEIKGGAKYTKKKKNWYPICIIDGFPDMRSACQCEWRLKHLAKEVLLEMLMIGCLIYLNLY